MKREKLLKRLEAAGQKAADRPTKELQRLLSLMTTEELKELADDNCTEARAQQILERVKAL